MLVTVRFNLKSSQVLYYENLYIRVRRVNIERSYLNSCMGLTMRLELGDTLFYDSEIFYFIRGNFPLLRGFFMSIWCQDLHFLFQRIARDVMVSIKCYQSNI